MTAYYRISIEEVSCMVYMMVDRQWTTHTLMQARDVQMTEIHLVK